MKMNQLRAELQALLTAPGTPRRPVLRRSLHEEWLYTTDLPGLCTEQDMERIVSSLASAGWESMMDRGWLQMKKTAEEPPKEWFDGPFGPEAGCCLSLIDRHPGGSGGEQAQRMLIKAGEQGALAYEEACALLHREWAVRLREGKRLPAVNRRYFSNERRGDTC